MVFFERLGDGVVKMTVHGKSGIDGRGDYIDLIVTADELDELEVDLHKAQGRRW